MPQLIIKTL